MDNLNENSRKLLQMMSSDDSTVRNLAIEWLNMNVTKDVIDSITNFNLQDGMNISNGKEEDRIEDREQIISSDAMNSNLPASTVDLSNDLYTEEALPFGVSMYGLTDIGECSPAFSKEIDARSIDRPGIPNRKITRIDIDKDGNCVLYLSTDYLVNYAKKMNKEYDLGARGCEVGSCFIIPLTCDQLMRLDSLDIEPKLDNGNELSDCLDKIFERKEKTLPHMILKFKNKSSVNLQDADYLDSIINSFKKLKSIDRSGFGYGEIGIYNNDQELSPNQVLYVAQLMASKALEYKKSGKYFSGFKIGGECGRGYMGDNNIFIYRKSLNDYMYKINMDGMQLLTRDNIQSEFNNLMNCGTLRRNINLTAQLYNAIDLNESDFCGYFGANRDIFHCSVGDVTMCCKRVFQNRERDLFGLSASGSLEKELWNKIMLLDYYQCLLSDRPIVELNEAVSAYRSLTEMYNRGENPYPKVEAKYNAFMEQQKQAKRR